MMQPGENLPVAPASFTQMAVARLKAENERLKRQQAEMLEALTRAGVALDKFQECAEIYEVDLGREFQRLLWDIQDFQTAARMTDQP